MKYKVLAIPPFDKQLKRLSKKYPSLKKEYTELIQNLESNPHQGKHIGNICYKVRISIASKDKGKSGGARVVFNIIVTELTVYLLSIYDKNEKEILSYNELWYSY